MSGNAADVLDVLMDTLEAWGGLVSYRPAGGRHQWNHGIGPDATASYPIYSGQA